MGGTWANGDTATLTVNTKDIVVTFGAGVPTTAQVAAALKAAWEGDAITAYGETRNATGNNVPEFAEATATVAASVVTVTADNKGRPFTLTVSETSAAGTLTPATATVATGPNHWDNVDNWDASGVPVSTDDVFIENSAVDILYGLAQSAVTLTSLNFAASFTGKIGLADINTLSTASYYEYRAKTLAVSATTINVGKGPGTGSGRIKLNVGSNACTLNVFMTATPAEPGLESVLWKGTHASNAINVYKGSLGIGVEAGDAATVATLRVGYTQNVQADSTVRCGTGVTLTTIDKSGGNLTIQSACTTVTQTDGLLSILAGAITTLTCRGGTVYCDGTGTLTTGTVSGKGTLDFTRDQRAKTVTNPIERYGDDSRIRDTFKVVTGLVIDSNEASNLSNLELGPNIKITRGAPT